LPRQAGRRGSEGLIKLKGTAVTLTQADLDALAAYDTPMICNALELVVPERRARGFNRRPLIAPLPVAKSVVGYARTATIRAREPHRRSKEEARELRLKYYAHVAASPRQPTLVVMQDLDGPDCGFGAFWGEVQSNVHKALGCLGVITDGSVRDIDTWAPGFFVLAGSVMPSHAHVDVVDLGGTVSVAGMMVAAGDLVHADRHGAVVIPVETVAKVLETAAMLVRREKVILDACRAPGFSIEHLRDAFNRMDEIH
jgi:regulator of RNase E activity RraA